MTSGIYKFLLILQKINNRKNFNKISVNYYNYYYKSSKLLDFNKLIFLKIDYYSYIKYKNFYFLIFWIFRINNTSGAYINNFTTSYFNLNLIYKRLFINLIKFTNHTNTLVFKKSTFVHYVYKFYLKNLIRKFFYTYKYFHNFYLNNNINVKNFFFTKFFIVFNVNKKYFLNYYKYFLISKLHSNNIINKYKFYQKINIIKNLIKTKSKIKKKFFKQIRKFNRKTKINLLQNFSVKRFKQLIRKKLPILSLRKKQNLFFYKRKKKFVLKKVALRSPGDDVAFFKKNFKKDELFKKYVVFKKHILFNKGFFFFNKFTQFYKKLQLYFLFFYYKIKFIMFPILNFMRFKTQYLMLKTTLHLIYKNFYYIGVLKKTRSNFFLTIINRLGEVKISYSIGRAKELKKRKKRKIKRSILFIIPKVAKFLKKKRIFRLRKLVIQSKLGGFIKTIVTKFFNYKIRIRTLVYIKPRSHGYQIRCKKLRRL